MHRGSQPNKYQCSSTAAVNLKSCVRIVTFKGNLMLDELCHLKFYGGRGGGGSKLEFELFSHNN